jgi:hypothetical protein
MSPVIPAIVFSLLIGGAAGFLIRQYTPATSGAAGNAAGASRGQGGPGGGGMGGGRGGFGGPQAPGTALAGLVRSLATIEQVQNQGLTPQQSQTILPVLKQLQSADKLSEQDAQAKMDAINKALTDPQKQAIESLQPRRGGGGGGRGGAPGGPGGPGGGMGGPGGGMGGGMGRGGGPGGPGGPGGGMMGGMGGGRPDPDHPFASERSKKSLTDLIGALEGPGKK